MNEEYNVIIMKIAVSEDFKLEKAVCNHGYFMMAPNEWLPSTKTLIRPLRLLPPHHTSLTASIHQPPNQNYLTVTLSTLTLSSDDRQFIQRQVERMLRISPEDEAALREFHKVHPAAKEIGFGRIFRSPDLFEDIIKSLLLCFSSWPRSLDMAEALCGLEHKLSCGGKGKKRKRCDCKGNFPNPKEIASLDVETLRRECKLGLRASTILDFAINFHNGTLRLDDLVPSYNSLLNIKGFGCFVAANVMMCLGFYQHIPVDTETIKHLEQVHGQPRLKRKKAQTMDVIAQIYDKYAPFQCLAYWMERVEFYEKHLGKLSELPNSRYRHVMSTNIRSISLQQTI